MGRSVVPEAALAESRGGEEASCGFRSSSCRPVALRAAAVAFRASRERFVTLHAAFATPRRVAGAFRGSGSSSL